MIEAPDNKDEALHMAKAKKAGIAPESEAKFPNTNKPASLRRFLKEIPKKPRPPKVDRSLLQSWGFRDGNDYSILRVLKAVNLLKDKNEPTELYGQFMSVDGGGRVLGAEIRRLYAPLFTAAHKPYDEGPDKLKNLFHIHSGGGERSIELQMQTFKALCESASFDAIPQTVSGGGAGAAPAGAALALGTGGAAIAAADQPVININLHIHLPENKSRRDYTDIIEDIGRYIFGRVDGNRRD